MTKLAHAKINLSLRVLARRADGFHEIESLIAPISLADSLSFEPSDQFEFICSDPALPTGEENLVVRAAQLFFAHTGFSETVRIRLEKKIPSRAGLGGGSSDAAATLMGLNEFFDSRVPNQDLMRLGAQLGSDVPFFLDEQPAICRGRGEIVDRVNLRDRLKIILLKPDFGVSTAWAYSRWVEARELPGARHGSQSTGEITFVNDLERPVFEKFVFLARVKTWLLAQSEVAVALMSGSGSAMFAVVRDGESAQNLVERARNELDPTLWAYACETL
jgi:4-diphosphocytidyl-2-C-methyl-D-erythritol kinase